MATTRVGITGPLAALPAFDPKAEDGRGVVPRLTRVGLTGPMAAYATFQPKGGAAAGAFYIFGDTVIE
jgi:hypothetical protein